MKNYYVYILLCENGALYTGFTTDLAKRYQAHLTGTGKCKYTRSFKPLKMVWHWSIGSDKKLALQLERKIKQLPKHEKERLIQSPEIVHQYIFSIISKK